MEEKKWFLRAKQDLKAAKDSLNSENFSWSCFQAQQAVETALKAVYIKNFKELIKTHNLVLLARKVEAPEKIIFLCSKINPSYLDTRYPDLSREYKKRDAEDILIFAKEVMEWSEKNL